MTINFVHARNTASLSGPQAALPILLANERPSSLLDVGCGNGTWLKAALDLGIADVCGVEGVKIPSDQLKVPAAMIQRKDLTIPWTLDRRFDVVICLEVAEHLAVDFAPVLIDALVKHSDRIYFSAACPGQIGQHHVNCQWPAYWQQLFNDRGYVCRDDARWRIWDLGTVEPWYRQNMFTARRAPAEAGKEARVPAVIHPKMMPSVRPRMAGKAFSAHLDQIRNGHMPTGWYLTIPFWGVLAKLKRKVRS